MLYYDTADGKMTATATEISGGGGRSGGDGGNSDSDNSSDSGGVDAAPVREAVELLVSRLAQATGDAAALRARLADAIKRTTIGRLALF